MRDTIRHKTIGIRPDQHDQLKNEAHEYRASLIQTLDAMMHVWSKAPAQTQVVAMSRTPRRAPSHKSPKPKTNRAV